MSPKKFYNPKININLIVENLDFGDWKLIYQVMRYDSIQSEKNYREIESAL